MYLKARYFTIIFLFLKSLGMIETVSASWTTGTTNKVSDGRLQLWLSPFVKAGDVYYIDDIRLEKASLLI